MKANTSQERKWLTHTDTHTHLDHLSLLGSISEALGPPNCPKTPGKISVRRNEDRNSAATNKKPSPSPNLLAVRWASLWALAGRRQLEKQPGIGLRSPIQAHFHWFNCGGGMRMDPGDHLLFQNQFRNTAGTVEQRPRATEQLFLLNSQFLIEKLSRCSHYWVEEWKVFPMFWGWRDYTRAARWRPRNVEPWRGRCSSCNVLCFQRTLTASGNNTNKKQSFFLQGMCLSLSSSPQMLFLPEELLSVCVWTAHVLWPDTPGLMAKHPGATEVLERDPLPAPVLCLPMPVVVTEGGQQEFGSLACRFNHSLVKRTPPPHPKRTNVVGNDCQMRWLVKHA